MHRAHMVTLFFALAAVLAVVIFAHYTYEGLSTAFENEFQGRIAHIAEMAASQLSAEDVDDVHRMGLESGGYFALSAQLDILKSESGFKNLAFVDTLGLTLYDVALIDFGLLARSPYYSDPESHAALVRAIAGQPSSALLTREGGETRAEFAPVRPGGTGPVIGVLIVEAVPTWQADLRRLRQRLTTIAWVIIATIVVLAIAATAYSEFLRRDMALHLARKVELERRSGAENLAAMGRMTATLAHEIKNPLAIIRGSAQRLGQARSRGRSAWPTRWSRRWTG